MKYEVELHAFDGNGELRIVDVPQNEVVSNEDELLDVIFKYGQNDFQPKNQRSVSVEDVIRLNDKRFRVDDFGFSEIKKMEKTFTSEVGMLLNDDELRDDFGYYISELRREKNWETWSSYHIGDLLLTFLSERKAKSKTKAKPQTIRMNYGLTEVKLTPRGVLTISHTGNMGASLKDVSENLRNLNFPSLSKLKNMYEVLSGTGSPDYMWSIHLKGKYKEMLLNLIK